MLGHDVVISTSIPNLRKQVAAIGNDFNSGVPFVHVGLQSALVI